MSHPAPVHFRAAGVSLVISLEGPVPAVLHWGADLGELDENGLRALALSTPTETPTTHPTSPRLTLLPTERDLWVGTPGCPATWAGGARRRVR